MGVWSFLFGENIRVEDEYFGSLLLLDAKKPEESYFEGWRVFAPTGQEIELGITGNLPGPTTGQREFYRQVEMEYLVLVPAIQSLITERIRKYKPDFTIQDFTKEFWPVYLSVPALNNEEQSAEWELGFETVHDKNHMFIIYISVKGFLPYDISMEG
ncbi:hypothetical protein [Hymenobacter cavernae]|uniref:Uncharacterized protein n=1 Tax=Hymenobacter cavernae TaxID=2044852 RepID=A0ABQ1USQ5_9BACT|nr:hypothetical protein [Hymenobacter cavernae]GGF24121.1 hypothetical protein GCM10011383_39720 [Hymenobacter cavernae]